MSKRDNVYFGLGYEHHAAGHFWRLGYEAFKIDADYGFDLLVNNQKKRAEGKDEAIFPCLVQVKAARVREKDWEEADCPAGLRRKAKVTFYFNKEHKESLLEEKNAYLLCYITEEGDEGRVLAYFWLSHHHLQMLDDGCEEKTETGDCEWFIPSTDDGLNIVRLSAVFYEQASLKSTYEEQIKKVEKCQPDVAKELNELTEKTSLINLNSCSYVKLLGNKPVKGGIMYRLNPELMCLANFQDAAICQKSPFLCQEKN